MPRGPTCEELVLVDIARSAARAVELLEQIAGHLEHMRKNPAIDLAAEMDQRRRWHGGSPKE